MPDKLVKQCDRYIQNVLFRDEILNELDMLPGMSTVHLPYFKFANIPSSEVKFVEEFTGDMYDWISSDMDRKYAVDHSPVSISVFAELIVSIKALMSIPIHTPDVKANLDFLVSLVDTHKAAICSVIVFNYIKVVAFMGK